jgi:hypothetical protein
MGEGTHKRLYFYYLLLTHTHSSHQKVRVVLFWVNLSTDLLRIQRIALFGENVHILYVAEMVRNSGLLL